MTADADIAPSPFHIGEQQVQQRLGVRDIENWARKVVRPYLPEQHRDFHTRLPFLIAAARDEQGRPWVTVLTGPNGFVTSPNPEALVIDASLAEGDALTGRLDADTEIGLLGIEFATRRRNRVNGWIEYVDAGSLVFKVGQSFGNCPQYIREREWRYVENEPAGLPVGAHRLSPSQQKWISSADTFFIGSGYRGEGEHPAYGMDASHRGGDPGFVQVQSETRLMFPDYAGNNHLNTIGNLVLDPRAGLSFVDFETGSLLQITGRVTIDWDSSAVSRVPGARRLVYFDLEELVELPTALPLRWDANAESVRSLRLVERIRESDDVASFIFESSDGGPLPLYQAGQHLPIELHVTGVEEPVRRTYTLSGAPGTERYRISVKRELHGVASRHLHDTLETGTIIEARKPAGEFVLTCGQCPVVLISAGVGVTPMVSMLHSLSEENDERTVWFVHGARDGDHHPLASEVRSLAARRQEIHVHFAYSRPKHDDVFGTNYDSEGRINRKLLERFTNDPAALYMVCGPKRFMAQIQTDLEILGVPREQIHTESFGPES